MEGFMETEFLKRQMAALRCPECHMAAIPNGGQEGRRA
jgi:hypothetical protein